ncbi:MAG: DNA cytosine methyltransferase [Opitutae bacterium]|nr:DNA cytosine methyltransferase [Opitutae bacterium]
MKNYTVTSLFSGCGGLDLGFRGGFEYLNQKFEKLKFETIFANDIDSSACATYERNLDSKIICGDINQLELESLKFSNVLLGGFPCQDFSHAGKRLGLTSKRGSLYKSMCAVIEKIRPNLFIAENVKGLMTIDKGNAIKVIVSDFKEIGYNVTYKLLKVHDFGVSQKRERVIIIGTNSENLPPFDFDTLREDKAIAVFKAIADLEDLPEGHVSNHYWSKAKKNKGQGNKAIDKNDFAPTMRAEHHGNIEFHWNSVRRLSAREAARIQSFPDDFIFYPSTSSAYKQIGNAVPPVFAWHIAKAIQLFLEENL